MNRIDALVRGRTTLVGLDPIGLGTPLAEGLTGYVARLAWAHRLPPATLLRHVAATVLAGADPSGIDVGAWQRHLEAGLRDCSLGLLGHERTSATWVAAFERLTGRDDLAGLTLRAWSAVLPTLGLVRPTRAFCPDCLAAWARDGLPAYEPLAWSLRPVRVCVVHGCALETACPSCGHERWPLTAFAIPGACAECGGSLAFARARDLEGNEGSREYARWVAVQVGELVAASATVEVDPLALPAAVERAAELVAAGNLTCLAASIGTSLAAVSLWKDGRRVPSLERSLRLCHAAGFRLVDFLAGNLGALEVALPERPGSTPREKRPYRQIDWEAVRTGLEAALDETPAPSLLALTRRFGVANQALRRHEPALATAIVARHRAARRAASAARRAERARVVIEAIDAVAAEGRYPSRLQVDRRLPRAVRLRDRALLALWRSRVVALGFRDPSGRHPERGFRAHRASS